jgi:hypothetical protein
LVYESFPSTLSYPWVKCAMISHLYRPSQTPHLGGLWEGVAERLRTKTDPFPGRISPHPLSKGALRVGVFQGRREAPPYATPQRPQGGKIILSLRFSRTDGGAPDASEIKALCQPSDLISGRTDSKAVARGAGGSRPRVRRPAAVKKKRELFPGPPPTSRSSVASPHDDMAEDGGDGTGSPVEKDEPEDRSVRIPSRRGRGGEGRRGGVAPARASPLAPSPGFPREIFGRDGTGAEPGGSSPGLPKRSRAHFPKTISPLPG